MDRLTMARCLAATSLVGGCLAQTVPATQGEATAPAMTATTPAPPGTSPREVPAATPAQDVDILVEIDNSHSMRDNQAQFSAQVGALFERLLHPPVDPRTGVPVARPVRSLHVGVISQDLGTPGSTVPSCADSEHGDDGLLNPVRNGQALRQHEPWTTLAPGARPDACDNDPALYPAFLGYDASTDPAGMHTDVVCNTLLGTNGCGLEAQLEAAYRALVIHDARTHAGNTDPNAGFLRDNAILAVVLLTDEEDGSVRDCRYAEHDAQGHTLPCNDALTVYDDGASGWASPDLNLRFYLGTPGGADDPTWPIDRYVDPTDPSRGFPGLKPGHPERVVFAAITGVPLALPQTAAGHTDWNTLLGHNADGSDGMVGTAAEGDFSMRQANADPQCPTRTVPACHREGSRPPATGATCYPLDQYFAWPARRIAQVARRFEETWQNGVLGSICAADYSPALTTVATRIQAHLPTP